MAWSVLSKPYGLPYILPEAIKVMIIFGRMRYSAHLSIFPVKKPIWDSAGTFPWMVHPLLREEHLEPRFLGIAAAMLHACCLQPKV